MAHMRLAKNKNKKRRTLAICRIIISVVSEAVRMAFVITAEMV